MLKAASTYNQQYIDRIMVPFMKTLQKLYKDHLNSISNNINLSSNPNAYTLISNSQNYSSQEGSNYLQIPNTSNISINSFSELLIQSIDLIKYRIGVMSIEMRKIFINSILISLIEKSPDLRVVKYLIKLINDWVVFNNSQLSQTHTNNILINQIPTTKEKIILLQRLSTCVEKRFPENSELQKSFLEIVLFVYQNEMYATNVEFKIKLEPAFLMGLRSFNPDIRQKFFEIFDKNFNSNEIYERLSFIILTQNWELFGQHFWIKQCIQISFQSCVDTNRTFELYNSHSTSIKYGHDDIDNYILKQDNADIFEPASLLSELSGN
jgi:transformation/transcription domain-associated protein